MKKAEILPPEFVKRMVVDAENLVEERKRFFRGEIFTSEEIQAVVSVIPYHHEINWGPNRLSMIPWSGLENIQHCIEDTVVNKVEGDYLETGVWRGGSCIIAKSVYEYLGSKKNVYLADSFEGLPRPDADRYPDDKGDSHYLDDNMRASLENVKVNFQKFGLLDERVIFLKGWFKDTMPTAPIDKLSILRLDGDMFESTIDVLKYMYHKLSLGGYCIIDDYQHIACRTAIQNFRMKNGITEPIIKVDDDPLNEVHYWIKRVPTVFSDRDYVKRGLARSFDKLKSWMFDFFNRAIKKVARMIS